MSQELRDRIVTEARSWVDTPHIHQACEKGVGVDCAMLIRAVGETCGVVSVNPATWQRFANYSRTPNPSRMGEGLATFMVPIDQTMALPGDVMWLQWRDQSEGDEALPMHLAILATRGRRLMMIHAYARAGQSIKTGQPEGRVVEHGFTAEWPGRVVSWWRYPGLVKTEGCA